MRRRAAVMSLMTVFATPGVADAGAAVPDSATMAMLREAAGRAGAVRVIGRFGQRDIHHVVLDSTGVRSADWAEAAKARQAVFESADTPHPAAPAPIAWSEIEEMKTAKQHKLAGGVIGGVLGLAAAVAAIGSSDGGEELGGYGVVVGSVTLGALIGTFIGSLAGSKTIYRAQENH